jgi:hypothetical protein
MLIIGSIYRVIYNNINLISDEILCWFRDKVSFFSITTTLREF